MSRADLTVVSGKKSMYSDIPYLRVETAGTPSRIISLKTAGSASPIPLGFITATAHLPAIGAMDSCTLPKNLI